MGDLLKFLLDSFLDLIFCFFPDSFANTRRNRILLVIFLGLIGGLLWWELR